MKRLRDTGAELLELTSGDGTRFSAALAVSPGSRGPGVIIFPDVRGLYPFYSELAERFASARDLAADEPGVKAVTGKQFIVAAGFDKLATIEHREEIGVAYRRQSMGNDDRRAVTHQRVERAAYLRFADCIKVRGRLVEDQGRCIL